VTTHPSQHEFTHSIHFGSCSSAGTFECAKPLAAVKLIQAETGLAPLHD